MTEQDYCPVCGEPIDEPPMVDIGVGGIPCGPRGCEDCGWVEEEARFDADDA